MPFDLESFVASVEDALPCLFVKDSPNRQSTVLAGSGTLLDLNTETLRLDISTPVPGAHDGLPAGELLDLLAFNFPNDLTRGSFLARGGGAGHLVLTAALPVEHTTPDEACSAILDQVAAALALAERIVQRRTDAFNKGI